MTVTSTSSTIPAYNPSFFDGAEAYCAKDISSPIAAVEGKKPVFHSAMQTILQKWKDQLFPINNLYGSHASFTQKNTSAPTTNESLASALHYRTHKVLSKNKATLDKDAGKVQALILAFAATQEDGEGKEQLTQLAMHPRMLMRCSENYVREVAKQMEKNSVYRFNLENVLSELKELNIGSEEARQAIRIRANDLFPEKYLTSAELAKIDGSAAKMPDIKNMDPMKAFDAVVYYMLQITRARINNAEKREDILEKTKEALTALMGRYEAGNIVGDALARVEAAKARLAENAETAKQHAIDSKENEDKINAEIAKTSEKLKQAENALYYYPTTKKAITPRIEEKKQKLEDAKATLAKAQEENIAESKRLAEENKTIRAEIADLTAASKEKGIKAEFASGLSDDIINQIQLMIDNVGALQACLDEYLMYAINKTSREVQPATKGWFGW